MAVRVRGDTIAGVGIDGVQSCVDQETELDCADVGLGNAIAIPIQDTPGSALVSDGADGIHARVEQRTASQWGISQRRAAVVLQRSKLRIERRDARTRAIRR